MSSTVLVAAALMATDQNTWGEGSRCKDSNFFFFFSVWFVFVGEYLSLIPCIS